MTANQLPSSGTSSSGTKMDAVLDLELNQITQHSWCPVGKQWVDESNLVKPHEYFCRACQKNHWGGIGPGSITDHCALPKHQNKIANHAPQTRAPGEPARKLAKAPAPLPQILAVQSRSRSPIRRRDPQNEPHTTSKCSSHPRLQPIAFVAETETLKVSIPQPPPPPFRPDPMEAPPFMQPPPILMAANTAIVPYRTRPSSAPELHDRPEGMWDMPGDEPPRQPTSAYQMLPQFQHPDFPIQMPAPRHFMANAGVPMTMPMTMPMSSYGHSVSPINQPPMQSGPQVVYVPMLLQMQPRSMSTHSGFQVLPFFPDF